MQADQHYQLSKKPLRKAPPRNKPLPKATQKYLEAEEGLAEQMDELNISYRRKYKFMATKHWRFDFYLVKKRLLIEIAGGPWSRGKAWSMDRYDVAEKMGFIVQHFHPDQIESGYALQWIKDQLAE